jgi:hypothetical protein
MKKLTLEYMKNLATTKGGLCLSTEYINSTSKLLWRCNKEHEWSANPGSIVKGTWCPECNIDNHRLTIEDMQKIAKQHNGFCLSVNYKNLRTKMKWKNGNYW